MKAPRYIFGVLLITVLLFATVHAQSFSKIVVLGDSLSDNGNLYAAIGYPPEPPYWEGRASNGPVAAEYLAEDFAIPLDDFAFYAGTTGVGNLVDGGTVNSFGFLGLPGMATVFQQAIVPNPIDPNALYMVWGSPNDVWNATDAPSAQVAIAAAVTNLGTILGALEFLGAQHIVMLNMPDLGITPKVRVHGPRASYFFTQIAWAFNQALKANLPDGVHHFDTYGLLSHAYANLSEYGFTNATDPFLSAPPGADPDTYVFFDDAHPTTAVHALIADALYQSVAPTVIIGDCDSGVPNPLLTTGVTVSDLIAQAEMNAKHHGQFVSAVASITNDLMTRNAIAGSQKGAIQHCAAMAN